MAVNPVTGDVYVTNTEARNEVRFEGPGVFGGSTVQGHLAESRITVVLDADRRNVKPRHLNKHIDYGARTPAPRRREAAQPRDAGRHGRVDRRRARSTSRPSAPARIGVFDTAALENDTFDPTLASAELHHGQRRWARAASCSTSATSGSTCSRASTTRCRWSTSAPASRSDARRAPQPGAGERRRRPAVPLRRVDTSATARRRARAATSSATWTSSPGTSATRTTRSRRNPMPIKLDDRRQPALRAADADQRHRRRRVPSHEGPDDHADAARARTSGAMHWRGDRATRLATRRRHSTRPLVRQLHRGVPGPGGPRHAARRPPTCRRSPTSRCRSRCRRTRCGRSTTSLTRRSRTGPQLLHRRRAVRRHRGDHRPAPRLHLQRAATRLEPRQGFFGTDGDASFENEAADRQDPAPAQPVPEGRHVRRRSTCRS